MATDQEMMDRIAKLSNAIEQQKHMASSRGGYYARGRPFRGRGGNMSLSNTPPRHPTAPYYPANNKYINPATVKLSSAANYVSPSIKANHQHRNLAVNTPASPMSTPSPLSLPPQSRNKKLIINHKGSNATTSNTMVKSINTATGRKQVAIDGVDFVVKGKKLIRKDLFDSNMTKTNLLMANSTAPKVLIRKSIKR
ncbi:Phosphodiesterase [Mucor velutinosus]|uniref:Phosphodiesterase n=1 Tax=Mucor velutinosus TaxID=708070 RepID=A0AAN7I0T1_9FUNG|nr:Phosphodiesterase [Mucor velutinosus]